MWTVVWLKRIISTLRPVCKKSQYQENKSNSHQRNILLLNKPAGVVSAVSDKEHQTVIDLIKEADRVPQLYPVGRLDRSTEGLLLITNNGPLGYRMLHPKYHVAKTYYVEVNAFLADDAPAFFENGVSFDDGTICKSAKLELITASTEKSSAYVTISEGKFHQIKKTVFSLRCKSNLFETTNIWRISTGRFTKRTIS